MLRKGKRSLPHLKLTEGFKNTLNELNMSPLEFSVSQPEECKVSGAGQLLEAAARSSLERHYGGIHKNTA